MTSALVLTSCTRRVQENAAIGLVVLQTAEILWLIIMFRNTFPMRNYCIINLSLGDQGKVYYLSLGMYFLYTWCTSEC